MKRLRVVLLLASLTMFASALVATDAFGATTHSPKGGTVNVADYGDGSGAGGTVVLTGAIGDFGSSVSIDANGTVDPQNNTEVILALTQGSFRISVVSLDKKINAAFNKFQPSSTTCSGQLSVPGTTPIVAGSGTGAYEGISGSFNLTLTFAEIGPKLKSGKCNDSNSAPALGSAMIVIGSGTVSYS